MFPIILILILLVIFIVSLKVLIRAVEYDNFGLGTPSAIAMATSFVMAIVTIALWLGFYFSSVGDITRLEAFYYDTLDAYEYTITATGEVDIINAEAGLVDIAFKDQGVATSERLRELRDKIEWYNARIRHYERFNGFFIADSFLADLPDDLIPIRLSVAEKES